MMIKKITLVFVVNYFLVISSVFSQVDVNTVAYWKFNETNGVTTVSDETNNNLDGTFTGAGLAYGTSTAFSGAGNALNFTGSDYVTVPNNAVINTMQNSMTIEAWIYQTDGADNTIIDRGNYNFLFQASANSHQSYPLGTTGLGFYNNGAWSYSTTPLPVNTWVHVAMTWNDATKEIKFYVNGVLTDTIIRSSSLTFNDGNLNIGRQDPDGCRCNVMDGQIDELRLSNVVRTETEILAMKNINTTPPVITLNGANPQFLEKGSPYIELNASANDDTDGDISGNIIIDTSNVNMADVGTYTVTYNVSDAAGNPATEVVRTVNVLEVTLQAVVTNASCINSSDGSVLLTPSGGTAPYTFGRTEFEDDFANGIEFNYYLSNDITTNDNGSELELTAASSTWQSNFITNQTFTREAGLTFEGSVYISDSGYKAVMIGFNDGLNTNETSASHGIYFFNNGQSDVTINARIGAETAGVFPTTSYSFNGNTGIWFDYKITLNDNNGATYAVKKSTEFEFTNTYTTTLGNLSSFKLGVQANTDGMSTASHTHKNWRVYNTPTATSNLIPGQIYNYEVRDANGFIGGTTIQVATNVDSENPVVSLVGDTSVNINLGETYNDPGATATDNCAVFGAIVTSGTINNAVVGAYTLTYTAKDEFLNEGSITRTVNVIDNIDPTAVAQDVTVQLDDSGNATITAAQINNGSTDIITSSANLTLELDKTSFSCDDLGGACATSYALDFDGLNDYSNLGNLDYISTGIPGEYTVEFWINPRSLDTGLGSWIIGDEVSTNNGVFIMLDANGAISLYGPYSGGVVATNSTLALNTWTHIAIAQNASGTKVYFNGVLNTSLATVNVETNATTMLGQFVLGQRNLDAQLDELRIWNKERSSTEINENFESCVDANENGLAYYFNLEEGIGNTITDATSGVVATLSNMDPATDWVTNSAITTSGNVVTLTVTDEAGNSSTATANITVEDNINPTITLNGDSTYNIEVGGTFTDLGATPADNCSATLTTSGTVDLTTVDSYVLTYKAVDASGNESDPVTRTVNVVDTTKPIIRLLTPGTQTLEVHASYDELGAEATDNYDDDTALSATIVIDASNVDMSEVGTYIVTYNVEDSNENHAIEVQRTVNVVDTTDPVITLEGDALVTIEVGSIYSDEGATALDNYDGDLTGGIIDNVSTTNPDTTVVGQYTITYNVTDANNNSATQVTRTVEVVDTTKPVITLTGDDPQRLEYNEFYTELGATATDNYDSNVSITSAIVIDAANALAGIGTLGTYIVTYNVTDVNGNIADTVTRTVIVEDTTKPELTIVGDNPQLIEIIEGADAVYVELGATASDEYDVDVDDVDIVIDTSALTPNLGTVGCYPVTYTVTDASGNSRTRTRVVFVLEEGMPWAKDDSFAVGEDSVDNDLDILANDSYGTDGANTQGAPISLYGLHSTHGGTLAILNGMIRYTPRAGFKGVDDFKYLITDDTDDSRTATVTIVVDEEPSPTAVDYEIEVIKNSGVTSVNVLENSTYGSDGAAASNALTVGAANSAEGGTTVVNGTTLVDYAPATDFTGLDSFYYTLTDLDGDTSTGVVLIRVIEDNSGVTSGPMIAKADAFTVSQNTTDNVLNVFADNGSGEDDFGSAGIIDEGLTMINGTDSGASFQGGTLVVNNQGTVATSDDRIEYTPKTGFIGEDGFYYRISDANGATSITIVTITVEEIATPTAVADAVSVVQDSGVTTIDVLANDSFGSDGAAVSGSLALPYGTSTTLGGTVVVNGGAIDYTPPVGITGTDSFQYTIEDASGDISSDTTVTITIIPPGLSDTPTAQDDAVTFTQDTTDNIISVLDNDEYGSDGPSLTESISLYGVHTRHGGVLVVYEDSSESDVTKKFKIKYTPRAGFVGIDEFRYLITDATNESSTATVTITVNAPAPPKEDNGIAFKTDFMVYPNPSEGDVNLSVYSLEREEVSVILFDVTGKVIYNKKETISIGNNTLDFHVNVKSGFMFLKVYSENTNFGTKKVVFK